LTFDTLWPLEGRRGVFDAEREERELATLTRQSDDRLYERQHG
jgi:hypothetical protein